MNLTKLNESLISLGKALCEGASNIDFELPKEATKSEIEKAFKAQQQYDRDRNGNADGYSGDFQTVNKVDYRYLDPKKVFDDVSSAQDFCLDKAEKWETVVAVYYKDKNGKVNTLVCGWGAE